MLVFRDVSSRVPGSALERELARRLQTASRDPLALLLCAADVECALEDAKHPLAEVARTLTDELALLWLGDRAGAAARAGTLLARLRLPAELRLRRPEGYAFYALDPRAYADVAFALCSGARPVRVVGIRTIGTSLAAVVRASLTRRGLVASRTTVRPDGPVWDRRLRVEDAERAAGSSGAFGAELLIVDEGPGLSGSTFLAVADALRLQGIGADRLRLLASHPFAPERLLAPDAARRYSELTWAAAPPRRLPDGAREQSGGAWRRSLDLSEWPPSWPLQERVKYLDATGRRLHKFSGLGPYGEPVLARARLLADAGYGPEVAPGEPGFLAYAWLGGRPAHPDRDRPGALRRIAEYLAFRARELPAEARSQAELEEMTALNLNEALGVEPPRAFELVVERPVVPDGRLQPHEWIVTGDARLVKTDGDEHGDDHLYPGPTDLAWDIAGAVVEWDLDGKERAELCRALDAATGGNVARRLPSYELAYSAFRLGVCDFAARDTGQDESTRWRRARELYERRARAALVDLRTWRSASP